MFNHREGLTGNIKYLLAAIRWIADGNGTATGTYIIGIVRQGFMASIPLVPLWPNCARRLRPVSFLGGSEEDAPGPLEDGGRDELRLFWLSRSSRSLRLSHNAWITNLHHLSYRRRAALIAVFYAWLTQDLLPKVNSGAVIVMDNATFHKRKDMLEAIENCGCIPEF